MNAPSRPRILLLSAYDTGSHRHWCRQLIQQNPIYDWQLLSLPPRYFRWRIRGNPLSWYDSPELVQRWDLVVATSMVDLATLKGIRPALAGTPTLLYMHENQFAYPVSSGQHQSLDPQMVNLYSAAAADRVVFNSDWNRRSFLDGARALFARLPDATPERLLADIEAKSRVLPVPVADVLFEGQPCQANHACPHLLWNHRWEYDKGPDRLLALCRALADRGQDFRLSVVGEQFRQRPEAFDQIHRAFASRILNWGFIPGRADYEALLRSADVVVSTASHDFQGLAMLEAMAAGCLALAPDRLAYPEYVPANQRYASHPDSPEREVQAAAGTLEALLSGAAAATPPLGWSERALAPRYQALLASLLAESSE
ncbi:MAG: DUF3524 domain-containing protein [Marinobacter sp.]|uniref:tRNA-queuosine alpha-mannosyltransferase domain-containing protein n=1 Tax=Marinobacter sp. TaxID=50741 RepID=UPI00299D051E|nr:DUF3524 domain-containing protein [Marinobacter sp.]MDX1635506.1 DUF3524 domain-containing protein [Marinobacter sp.]